MKITDIVPGLLRRREEPPLVAQTLDKIADFAIQQEGAAIDLSIHKSDEGKPQKTPVSEPVVYEVRVCANASRNKRAELILSGATEEIKPGHETDMQERFNSRQTALLASLGVLQSTYDTLYKRLKENKGPLANAFDIAINVPGKGRVSNYDLGKYIREGRIS